MASVLAPGVRPERVREQAVELSDEEIQQIALEHVRWARANGQSFERIIASLDSFAEPNFDNTVLVVARAQAKMADKF